MTRSSASLDPPKTHAQASRQRRDLVSGAVADEADLIRFVIGPDGTVVPDVARKLGGRGLWVLATREAVEQAANRGGFSRGARAKVVAPPDLADRISDLLRERVLSGLGLLRRSGHLVIGFEGVDRLVRSGACGVLIEASDGAEDGRRKLWQAAFACQRAHNRRPQRVGLFSSDELSLALGLENVIHLGLRSGRGSESWARELKRLSGFRPLVPPSWGGDE